MARRPRAARRAATTRWCSARWCATTRHFYDPLGLESRGTASTSRSGANAYLYGTRFFTWLAYVYSPEKVVAWLRRDEGSERYYADQFQQVFGISLDEAWQDWIAFEHEFQRRNLAEVRKYPITPHTHAGSHGARLDLAHVSTTSRPASLYARSAIPGVVEHVGALEHARRQRPAARRHQGRDALSGSPRSPTTRPAARPSTPTTTSRCAT